MTILRFALTALMLGQVVPAGLSAEPVSFGLPRSDLGVVIRFHVPRTDRRYGLLVQAPKAMLCALVRYRVEGAGTAQVSRGLAAGELALVSLRGPWPPGQAELTVTPLGCAAKPRLARRVMLDRASPDHGWRGGEFLLTKDARKAGAMVGDRPPVRACGSDGAVAGATLPALALGQTLVVPCG